MQYWYISFNNDHNHWSMIVVSWYTVGIHIMSIFSRSQMLTRSVRPGWGRARAGSPCPLLKYLQQNILSTNICLEYSCCCWTGISEYCEIAHMGRDPLTVAGTENILSFECVMLPKYYSTEYSFQISMLLPAPWIS